MGRGEGPERNREAARRRIQQAETRRERKTPGGRQDPAPLPILAARYQGDGSARRRALARAEGGGGAVTLLEGGLGRGPLSFPRVSEVGASDRRRRRAGVGVLGELLRRKAGTSRAQGQSVESWGPRGPELLNGARTGHNGVRMATAVAATPLLGGFCAPPRAQPDLGGSFPERQPCQPLSPQHRVPLGLRVGGGVGGLPRGPAWGGASSPRHSPATSRGRVSLSLSLRDKVSRGG